VWPRRRGSHPDCGGVAVLALSMKLPLRPFFRVAGMLIFYLGFTFGAAGLHSLQVAGAIPSTPIAGLSSHSMALLLGALAIWMILRASQRRAGRLGAGA